MSEIATSSNAPRQLAGKLKTLRKDSGVSQSDMAELLNKTQSWISLVENGQVGLSEELIIQWCDALHASPKLKASLKSDFVREYEVFIAWQTEPNSYLELQLAVTKHERAAKVIRDFNVSFIGGLYQCPQYIEAIHRTIIGRQNDLATFEFMQGRLARQALLHSQSTQLEGVIFESALRLMYGSPSVMVRQLEHLAFVIERELAQLAIVPSGVTLSNIPYSNWMMFDDHFAVIELLPGQISIAKDEELAKLNYAYSSFWDIALKNEHAMNRILEIARDYEKYEKQNLDNS